MPFLADGRCLYMVPSDPKFGGSSPQFAKGRLDGKTDAKEEAIREGEEELGLRRSNMAAAPWLAWSGKVTGLDEEYTMDVYAVLVEDENAFDKPHYETAETVWLTRSEFTTKGRKTQIAIMDRIFDKIEAYLGDK